MALTPNTAQFLDSLAFGTFDQSTTSLAPSTLFQPLSAQPVPGRDTPEDSPASSLDKVVVSDDSDGTPERDAAAAGQPRKASLGAQNKRKAGHSHTMDDVEDDEDDDSGDEAPSGHEDKRPHGNDKRAPRRSSGKDETRTGKDSTNKAQRRKEQNRAAQKAFRERREAKVRDLEEKVAALEAKSYGANVENESLRGILKRLQEENVALKQAAFTFSVPHGSTPSSSAATPAQSQARPQPQPKQDSAARQQQSPPGIDWSAFSNFKPVGQVTKPLSPPQSASGTSAAHRSSSNLSASVTGSGSGNSPESLVSISSASDNQRSLFDPVNATFNSAFDIGTTARDGPPRAGHSPTATTNGAAGAGYGYQPGTSTASLSAGSADVDALFRSFYPNGIAAVNGIDAIIAGSHSSMPPPQPAAPSMFSSSIESPATTLGSVPLPTEQQRQQQQQLPPYQVLGRQTSAMSPADSSSNLAWLFGDSTSYRDTSATQGTNPTLADNSMANWSDLADSSVSEFLASLTGQGVGEPAQDGIDADDANQQQLQALLAASSPNGGGFSNLFSAGAFSPTNYLNMSPSPLNSVDTPGSVPSGSASASASASNHTSPESDGPLAPVITLKGDCLGPSKSVSEVVHVVGADGNIMRPAEVWTKIGIQLSRAPEDLWIDDLCDVMKAKATCRDGQKYITYDDVTHMTEARGRTDIEAAITANRARASDLMVNPKPYTCTTTFSQDQMPARPAAADGTSPPQPGGPGVDVADDACPSHNLAPGEHPPSFRDPQRCQSKVNEHFIANGGLV